MRQSIDRANPNPCWRRQAVETCYPNVLKARNPCGFPFTLNLLCVFLAGGFFNTEPGDAAPTLLTEHIEKLAFFGLNLTRRGNANWLVGQAKQIIGADAKRSCQFLQNVARRISRPILITIDLIDSQATKTSYFPLAESFTFTRLTQTVDKH